MYTETHTQIFRKVIILRFRIHMFVRNIMTNKDVTYPALRVYGPSDWVEPCLALGLTRPSPRNQVKFLKPNEPKI